MKKIILALSILCLVLSSLGTNAQCNPGYTQAQVNWDNLDYYYNSGGGAPYNSYVTNTMALTQKFAIGINTLTVAVGSSITIGGDNTTNTGEAGSYGTGSDVQFTTTAATTTITLTFAAEVQNLKFSIYDLDNNQRVNISAVNAASVAQSVTLSLANGTSGITFSGNPGTNPRANGIAGDYVNTDNKSAINVDIATAKVVTISLSNATGDFWLSDITACILGSFPTNYFQLSGTTNGVANNQPFTGTTQNQADYFLVTPDNQYVYYSDPATGKTYSLFTDATKPFVNSLAYDPVNRICYYVTDGSSGAVAPSNKSLKKYDLASGTTSTVIADITATLNIPTFDLGIESAGAAFYNGCLYLGVEGGKYDNSNTRETIVYRVDFNASLNATGAAQVYSTPSYSGSTSLNDWGDFIIKDGVLYNFNTARAGGGCGSYTFAKSSVLHYDMTMDNIITTYTNPVSGSTYTGQVGLNWAGDIYSFWYNCNPTPDVGGIQKYNLNGTFAANTNVTVVSGPAWPGGAGDASDPFRPRCDFGDAPTTYDPNPVSPAVHERSDNIRLGNTWDDEVVKKGVAGTNDVDDGLAYVPVLNPGAANYLTQVYVYNNSGANATVCAWLDYNGNGVFDASEGITSTVPSSASSQLIWLYWPSAPTSLPMGSFTYLRVRVTSASAGMTTAMPTGFFFNGEVEDYSVSVNSYPLAVQSFDFNAQLTKVKAAKLTWHLSNEGDVNFYSIEKSINSTDWSQVEMVYPKMKPGLADYEITDGNVSAGITYYRLKTIEKDGKISISTIRQVDNKINKASLLISPNPVVSKTTVSVTSPVAEKGILEVFNSSGASVYKENININAGTNSVELTVASFASGAYVLNVTTPTQSLRQSLIVNK